MDFKRKTYSKINVEHVPDGDHIVKIVSVSPKKNDSRQAFLRCEIVEGQLKGRQISQSFTLDRAHFIDYLLREFDAPNVGFDIVSKLSRVVGYYASAETKKGWVQKLTKAIPAENEETKAPPF